MQTTRLLVVDDHRMFADGLKLLLLGEEGIQIIGVAGTAEEALELSALECPDVVLMDIDLPGMDGIEATRQFREKFPDARLVAISALFQPEVIAMAIEAGVSGFVPKTRAAEELLDVINRVAAREVVVPSVDIFPVLLSLQARRDGRSQGQLQVGRLTSREIDVLQAVAEGWSTAEVADKLGISRLTVRSHVKNILPKLGVHSKLEAVIVALRHGLISLTERV